MSQSHNECKKNKYTLCFKLKQHTPMIHFQAGSQSNNHRNCDGGEYGATLRGSEAKTKLDKFLIKYAFKNNKDEYKKYLNSHDSFRYDMTIILKKNGSKIIPRGSYFGKKLCAVTQQSIEIQIECFIPELFRKIEEYFEDFICVNSFMTRSGKEFGDYTLVSTDRAKFESIIKKYYYKIPLYLLDEDNEYRTIEEINDEKNKGIANAYKVLKSGDKKYQKEASLLMKYFLTKDPENPIRWEKRWIKHKLSIKNKEMFDDLVDGHNVKDKYTIDKNEKYAFIRPLLGYMENFEYVTKSYKNCNEINEKIKRKKQENKKKYEKLKEELRDKERKKIKNKIDENQKIIDAFSTELKQLKREKKCEKIIIKIKPRNPDFQRHSSPFVFKKFNSSYYFLLSKDSDDIPEICGEIFEFNASYKNHNKIVVLGKLPVPDSFSIKEFVKYTIERIRR